jgi:signal transduction histidine kinase
MNRTKRTIAASIARAKLELDDALEDLKALPAFDPTVLGFISHALKNYLHVASGTVYLLTDALKQHPIKEVRIWLDGLRNVTKRMTDLVEDIRSKPRTSAPELKFEKVDLVRLVGRVCDFYRRAAARKRIEILFRKPAALIPAVRTDRIALAAILDNLFSNAVKFSPPGKRVWAEVRSDANRVVCRVRDEGPGIRAEDREHLFQRGARLEAKPTGGETSSGYGLAVAAELAAQLGGELGCDSAYGKGASFFLRLPCRRRAQAPSRARRTRAVSARCADGDGHVVACLVSADHGGAYAERCAPGSPRRPFVTGLSQSCV